MHDSDSVPLSILKRSPATKPARKAAVWLAALLAVSAAERLAEAGDVTLKEYGVTLDAGTSGTFLFDYPLLEGDDAATKAPLVKATLVDPKNATLAYQGDAAVDVQAGDDGEVRFTLKNLPAGVTSAHLMMLVPYDFSQGGSYQIDDKPAAAFPAQQPAKPHLFQGDGKRVVLKTQDKTEIAIDVPEGAFLEVVDNRQWNWKTFALHVRLSTVGRNERTIKMTRTAAPVSGPRVDRFGQPIATDYPGKISSEADLKADIEGEKAYLASLKPPKRNRWGGLLNSGLALKKTGYFHTQLVNGKWHMVDPDGDLFFVKGVCTYLPVDDYTYIAGRESTYEWLPPFGGEYASAFRPDDGSTVVSFHLINQIRKYGQPYSPEPAAARMIDRLRAWGFNAVGPFSDDTAAAKERNFPYTVQFPLWSLPTIPGVTGVWDPFDPSVVAKLRELVTPVLKRNASDPRLIGYFLSNEPLFEDVPRVIPRLDGNSAAKRQFVMMLRKRYATAAAFNAAWKESISSLTELLDKPLVPVTDKANADVADFCDAFYEAYFSTFTSLIREHDKNHLIIGNRLQSGTINNERLMKIAAKYTDVVSFNYYTYGIDAAFLKRIHDWTGKPMMLTEYYFDSQTDSGLPGGMRTVNSQQQRGVAFRNYVEQSASLGFVLGTQWFTLVDQSYTGRWFQKYNGENGNTGLISVADRPYRDALAEMTKTNYTVEQVLLGKRPAFKWDDPRASAGVAKAQQLVIPRAAGTVKLDGTYAGFPGVPAEIIPASSLAIGSDAGGVEAAFKACWDDANLYLSVTVKDPTPQKNEQAGADLWRGDAVELFVGATDVEATGAFLPADRQIVFSGGKPAAAVVNHPDEAGIRTATFPAADGQGYTVQAAIPLKTLSISPKVGTTLRFDLAVDDSADGQQRLRQFVWNGSDRNSSDRSGWAKARLGQ